MGGFLLRLAGPMQSWGEHSAFGTRDTLAFPSRSGLIGMFAAARGLARGAELRRYDPLRITVRVDRPGVPMVDFHTVGGGVAADRTVPTAEGKRKGADVATIVTHRGYLAGAVFTVAVEAPDDLTEQVTSSLRAPYWPPYLGRRSHVPDPPLLLRAHVADPVAELHARVPLPAPTQFRDRGADTLSVDFVYEGEFIYEGEVTDGASDEATAGGGGSAEHAHEAAGVDTVEGANDHGNVGHPDTDVEADSDTDTAAPVPVSDRPRAARAERTVLSDIPRTFHAQQRQYATRAVTVLPRQLPRHLFAWRNHDHYLDALYSYARKDAGRREHT